MMWNKYETRTKMFLAKNVPLIPQVEISALASLFIFIAASIKVHKDATDEQKHIAAQASRLLAMDVAAPSINMKMPNGRIFSASMARKYNENQAFIRYVIDHMPSYIFRCHEIDGGRPYEALVTEAVMLLNSIVDCGYLVPDDDSPTMAAAALLIDMVNEDAEQKPERTEKIVKAAKRRLPEHQKRLQAVGLFKGAWT